MFPNALVATETISATGHSFGEWYIYSQAQFHTDGEERKDCVNCDYYESRRIPKLSESHTCIFEGTEEIVNNPTCTQSGSKRIYCCEAECGKYTTLNISLSFMASGTISNLADRLLHGFVLDYISVDLFHFPIFNLADVFISLSTIVLVYLFLFKYKENDLDFLNMKKKKYREINYK